MPQLFHRARRAFLRQLLLELGPALDSLGQTYWLDFGCLLGIHRCVQAAARHTACAACHGDRRWRTVPHSLPDCCARWGCFVAAGGETSFCMTMTLT